MSKRITMQARPNRGPQADQWVEDRKLETEKTAGKAKAADDRHRPGSSHEVEGALCDERN